jgi:hypothetical protein
MLACILSFPPASSHFLPTQATEQLRVKSSRLEDAQAEVDRHSRDSAHQISSLQATVDKLKASRGEQQLSMQAEVRKRFGFIELAELSQVRAHSLRLRPCDRSLPSRRALRLSEVRSRLAS